MEVKVFDNITERVRDDMAITIRKGSKVSIAAACFSMYAYKELKKQLEVVDECRFIFTSPTFVTEKVEKQKREFYIPRLNRERSLYGTEFEIKLRNEMTQKAIAKECADWIKRKATFKSNTTGENMGGFVTVENNQQVAYMPMNGFTTVDIGCERGNNSYNMINRFEAPFSLSYLQLFETLWNDKDKLQDVTDVVIENITTAYNENSPEFIYFMTLYHVFSEFLDDISEDELPNEATGFKQSKIWNILYDFQKDAVLAIINKLERYNGCILADSVGLGKTFTALAVVKYYENRNKSVLVLCPKKLAENWNTYKDNYINNPIAEDRLNYDVLFHTDLSRTHGYSNGLDLDRLNWGNYDLVVIDESHNFRNGVGTHANTRENRYMKLMDKIIRAGVKTKVLMLSATPVNNRFVDLKNQLAIAYEGNSENMNKQLNTTKTIEEIFKQAQSAFTTWSKLKPEDRTTDALLRTLDFDFFELLDSVTIARSRKHIEKYYDTTEIGKFPERKKPISRRPQLTDLDTAINYNEIYEQLMQLTLCIYTPSNYIFPSKMQKYIDLTHNKGDNLTQTGREQGIRRLMSINLLKRLESSVNSFQLTLERIKTLIESTISAIDTFEQYGATDIDMYEASDTEFDMDDSNTEYFTVGKKVKIELADMDYKSWRTELKADAEVLELLTLMVADITPEHDSKLQELLKLVSEKIENPINPENKKVLIFSAFSDTAEYLYDNVSTYIKKQYGLDTAVITGSIDGRTTIKGFKATLNNVLTCFSPISKSRDVLMPESKTEIDVLIATDCISEGQNEDFHFPGHTEYLEKCFGGLDKKALMILMKDDLRVALVTGHIPLSQVASSINVGDIVNKLRIFNQSLKQDFGIVKPRIAVLSLNPHAGDAGLLGTEEETIIIPAMQEAEKKGVMSFGPYAADGFFGSQMYDKFDGVLAMYHDQGLAPFKTLAMDDGVNYTAGLPIVRTSPAHGTAYDIAGQNVASEESFRQALYAALDIYRNRLRYQEATANPLRKQYFDRGGDNEKLDLTKDDDTDGL